MMAMSWLEKMETYQDKAEAMIKVSQEQIKATESEACQDRPIKERKRTWWSTASGHHT
jgi:hypothetical protein